MNVLQFGLRVKTLLKINPTEGTLNNPNQNFLPDTMQHPPVFVIAVLSKSQPHLQYFKITIRGTL